MVSGRQNQSPSPFRQTFWPDKWGLRERYGELNLDEKEFQLFQLFIDRFVVGDTYLNKLEYKYFSLQIYF